MKIITYLLIIVPLVALLIFCTLFFTNTGLQVIGQNVVRYSGGTLSIGTVKGRLSDEFTLGGLRVSTPGMSVTIGTLTWLWSPKSLFLGKLHLAKVAVKDVEISVAGRAAASPSPEASAVPPVSLLPVGIELDNLLVENLRITGGDGKEVVAVHSIAATARVSGDGVAIDSLSLVSPDIGFGLHGNIGAGSEGVVDLAGNWHLANFGFHPLQGTFSAVGPLGTPHLELTVNSSGIIRAAIDVVDLLEKPGWTGTLTAEDVDLSELILDCPKILLSTVSGELNGDLGHYRGRVKALGSWDTLQGMNLDSQLSGDATGIDFQSLRIEKGESAAEAENGKINWRDIFGWEGHFVVQNFDPSVITDQLPGKVSADLVSSGEVRDNGVVASFAVNGLDGVLRGQDISARGQISLSETGVHTDGLTIESRTVEGVAHIDRAMFSWSEQLSWNGEVYLRNFNPAILHEDFYGAVNAVFSGAGQQGDKGVEGYVDIADISGTLRGKNLSGGGNIRLSGDGFSTSGLTLKSGRSELQLQGKAGDTLGVDFSFISPDIGEIVPDSGGWLHVDGSVSESTVTPRLDLTVAGKRLRYGDISAQDLHATLQAELSEEGAFAANMRGASIAAPGMEVTNGRVDISGRVQDHDIAISLDSRALQVKGRARGRYDDRWQGQLRQFRLQSPGLGTWRQQGVAATAIGSSITVDSFCLADGPGSICMSAMFRAGENTEWKVGGDIKGLPLNVLGNLQPSLPAVHGRVKGDFRVTGNAAGATFAKVALAVPKISFTTDRGDGEGSSFIVNDSLLALDLLDGNLRANIAARPEIGGRLAMRVAVEGVEGFSPSFLQCPVEGLAELTGIDLGMVDAFTGYGIEPTGFLHTTLALGGTVGVPIVDGTIAIDKGGISLLQQGINLENVTLSVRGEGEQATIDGTASSGPGKLSAKGSVVYQHGQFQGDVQLSGNDFLLVNLPEYVIRVTPDVSILFSSERGVIEGKVEVPYGLITPEEMVDSVTVSEDVVFVDEAGREVEAKGWPFGLDLEVILGEEVRIDGYGLTGRLGGRLKVGTSKDNLLTGRGQLKLIDGVFSLYGRTLDIKRGRVLFNGGPIENPGLDVRAQVEVSDQQTMGSGYTVGVDISGLAENPKFSLFSTPYMEEKEILSLMVLGKSVAGSSEEESNMLQTVASSLGLKGVSDLAKGLGNLLPVDDLHLEGSGQKEDVSLVVGKRIFEDFYVGYDMNMFSQTGQFRVHYDLTRGFSVETRSSSESTGADLFYSFER